MCVVNQQAQQEDAPSVCSDKQESIMKKEEMISAVSAGFRPDSSTRCCKLLSRKIKKKKGALATWLNVKLLICQQV